MIYFTDSMLIPGDVPSSQDLVRVLRSTGMIRCAQACDPDLYVDFARMDDDGYILEKVASLRNVVTNFTNGSNVPSGSAIVHVCNVSVGMNVSVDMNTDADEGAAIEMAESSLISLGKSADDNDWSITMAEGGDDPGDYLFELSWN